MQDKTGASLRDRAATPSGPSPAVSGIAGIPSATVYDEFGAWALGLDEDGNCVAVQGCTEILILDHADMNRFGIKCLPQVAA